MKYIIDPKYIGNTVYTITPTYKRAEGGKFVLDSTLSDKDKGYLYEVIKHEAIKKDEKAD
ncbi:MAG: hypothetical protein WCX48_08515 [Bacteroidales bacterium]